MNKVTILVNSCDLYEDAWEPTFKLYKAQWPDCPYNFVLNTETKTYNGEFNNVRTVCYGKSGTWTERFEYVLNQIETPYVLFTLEDYFLLNKVNSDVFEKAVSAMDNNPKVGMVCLSHTSKDDIKTNDYEDENFYSRIVNPECMIWCRICLYRREYLLKLLRSHETIWEFEKYAAYRAMKLDYFVLQQNTSQPEVFTFKIKIEDGYGITLRKWLPKNIELFDKFGIQVNYDKLGMFDPKVLIKPPKSDVKDKSLKEKLYDIKRQLKNTKKNLKKQYRKFKSMH